MIDVYTDYPFLDLGDIPNKEAPIRKMKLIAYDGDKYVKLLHEETGKILEVKSGYVYKDSVRVRDSKGRVYLRTELTKLMEQEKLIK